MATLFGSMVTSYPLYANSSEGFIIRIDGGSIYLKEILFVQLAIDGLVEDPISQSTALIDLMAYPNDPLCPDLAYSYESEVFYLFLKTSYAPYASNVRFAVYGKRYAIPIKSISDKIDVKESDLEYFVKLAIKEAAQLLGKPIPAQLTNDIEILESQRGI